jgi:hypothetical protein
LPISENTLTRYQKSMFMIAREIAFKGRRTFFNSEDDDLPLGRSSELQQDDKVPQFGFVGSKYNECLLVIGINPGRGRYDDRRERGDAKQMPALHSFLRRRDELSFIGAMTAYKAVCETWHVWRHCRPWMTTANLNLENIAYTNLLPYRTESKAKYSALVAKKSLDEYVIPLVTELKPKIVVALGKRRPFEELSTKKLLRTSIFAWNRAQALTPDVIKERSETGQAILQEFRRVCRA